MKTIKRQMTLALAVILVLTSMVFPASAASTIAFDILTDSNYAKVFTLSGSGITIPYTNSSLSTRGTASYGPSSSSYIDNAKDELYLLDVGCTNGTWWAYISYPTSSGRVKAYIPLSAISSNDASGHIKTTSSGKFCCALRENSAVSSNYYVAAGDTVYLISVSGSKCQILYPISNGKWRLAWCSASDYTKYCSSQPVANGTYVIVSYLDPNKAVDIYGASSDDCANANLWTCNNTPAQDFALVYHPDGYYTIINVKSGKALDVAYGIAACGQNVWQYSCNGSAAQRWYLEDAGDGWFYIRSALGDNFFLDVNGAGTDDGTNLQIWVGKNNAQKFRFVPKNGSFWQWPMEKVNNGYSLTQDFNRYSSSMAAKGRPYHTGLDMVCANKQVMAAADGQVVYRGYSNGNGNHIVLKHNFNGMTVYSLYSHLANFNGCPAQGSNVSKGSVIATMGNTGNSTGAHLHFAIFSGYSTDPIGYSRARGTNCITDTSTGLTFFNPSYVISNNRLP